MESFWQIAVISPRILYDVIREGNGLTDTRVSLRPQKCNRLVNEKEQFQCVSGNIRISSETGAEKIFPYDLFSSSAFPFLPACRLPFPSCLLPFLRTCCLSFPSCLLSFLSFILAVFLRACCPFFFVLAVFPFLRVCCLSFPSCLLSFLSSVFAVFPFLRACCLSFPSCLLSNFLRVCCLSFPSCLLSFLSFVLVVFPSCSLPYPRHSRVCLWSSPCSYLSVCLCLSVCLSVYVPCVSIVLFYFRTKSLLLVYFVAIDFTSLSPPPPPLF